MKIDETDHGNYQEGYTHCDFLNENYDDLVQDGIRIRAVCDDLELDYEDFRAVYEIHTVFAYNPNVRKFFSSNRTAALKALDYLISAVDGSVSNSDIHENVEEIVPGLSEKLLECETYMNSFSSVESFAKTNFEVSKKLYSDDSYLENSLELYLSKVMPVMSSYDEYKIECAFDNAKEREYKKQKEIFDTFSK